MGKEYSRGPTDVVAAGSQGRRLSFVSASLTFGKEDGQLWTGDGSDVTQPVTVLLSAFDVLVWSDCAPWDCRLCLQVNVGDHGTSTSSTLDPELEIVTRAHVCDLLSAPRPKCKCGRQYLSQGRQIFPENISPDARSMVMFTLQGRKTRTCCRPYFPHVEKRSRPCHGSPVDRRAATGLDASRTGA